MSDLIDLNSPSTNRLLSSKLASPLIPVPSDILGNINNTEKNELSLITEKRESLENNPFDMVLHKTTEYVQKKHDPFEVILEKATTEKSKRKYSSRSSSIDFIDKYKHREKLKMNRTLDEVLFKDNSDNKKLTTCNIAKENIKVDLNKTNVSVDDFKSDNVTSVIVENHDLSILNQSVMNDILLENDKELNEDSKLTLESNNVGKMQFSKTFLKVPKLRRSFSQGEATSPKKLEKMNHVSLQHLRRKSSTGSTGSSANLTNLLNNGFLKSYTSENSVFSSLSNISSIPIINSPLMVSDNTLNRTFLESRSLEKTENRKLGENMDLSKEIVSVLPTENRSSMANVSAKSISDLTNRFSKLRARVSEIHVLDNSMNKKDELICGPTNDTNECTSVVENNEKEKNKTDKLIDVDIFIPDNNSSTEYTKSSISDMSSDSVFAEGKINKLISREAKSLARTFEEMATKSNSESNSDDFITNSRSWMLDLLPAFDDETSVENLIELPVSPNANNVQSQDVKIIQHKDSNSLINKEEENIKELETELVESAEKRLNAVSLLLDLKKLIKTENTEAAKLVENLEKVLGVNCDNNTELLSTYLNMANNLSKSPQKSSSSIDIIKNVENNMEHNEEENLTSNNIGSIKESASLEGINFNGTNTSKCINSQKYLNDVNCDSKYKAVETEITIEKIKGKEDENELSGQSILKENFSSKKENNIEENKKIVIELLANIGKLLSDQAKEDTTLDIIKSLREALNFTSNSNNVEKNAKSNDAYIEIQQTPKKPKLKFEKKTRLSGISKSVNRLSLNLESKDQPGSKNLNRKSMSISQTPSSSFISTGKGTSQLKEVKKRFSSDPGLNSPSLDKRVTINNNKNKSQKDTRAIPVATLDLQKEKTSMISTVKNKLKKKNDVGIVNKKGPMKAVLPVGNMQKKETSNKEVTLLVGTVTPPKLHKIISSTPNSTNNEAIIKKSRSKPVASSTPSNSKAEKIQPQVTNSPKKRNFSCDISPVTTRADVSDNSSRDEVFGRSNKLPSPKKTTPKRRPRESGIPKPQTPPLSKRLNSSLDFNHHERFYESPQRSYKKSQSQKNSPVSLKKNENCQRSPLRDNNRFVNKVKPINLISKLGRYTFGSNVLEKENDYI